MKQRIPGRDRLFSVRTKGYHIGFQSIEHPDDTAGDVGITWTGQMRSRLASRVPTSTIDAAVIGRRSMIGYGVNRSRQFEERGGRYVDVEFLQAKADVISLHCPLTPQTHHIVNARSLARIKKGALLINTSRGGLVDTEAVIGALKSSQLGLAIDVSEQEATLFFKDLSSVITDDVIQRLVSFPNVILTGHQAFFTARHWERFWRPRSQASRILPPAGHS